MIFSTTNCPCCRPRERNRIAELAGLNEDFDVSAIQAQYNIFNHKYFGGRLPTIPIRVKNMKRASGHVHVMLISKTGNAPSDSQVRKFGLQTYYEPDLETMYMEISSLFKRTDEALKGILLHEMIHVWFFSQMDIAEQHGEKFQKMADDLSRKSGIIIPLTDNIDDLELASDKIKQFVVVLAERSNGTKSFLICVRSSARNLEEGQKMWAGLLQTGWASRITAYTIKTKLWTTFAAKIPVSGNLATRARWIKMASAETIEPGLLDDLLVHGNVIADISNMCLSG